jgi:hypothetical protein
MVYNRSIWRDRFNEPTPQALRRELDGDEGRLFDLVRKHLRGLGDVEESVAWYGQSWCWCLEYRPTARSRRRPEPFAVVVPSPTDLQLAMPLDRAFITSLPQRRLKRAVRDGLELAQEPFDTNWAVWSIQHASLLDELKDVVVRRHASLSA